MHPEGQPVSYSTYTNHGCRCDGCRKANTNHCRKRAEARHFIRPIPPSVRHGSASTYSNWGCRCEGCSAAHSVYYSRHAKRERATGV